MFIRTGVYEAKDHPHLIHEMKMIEEALKLEIPILGICLGSQLLAEVLGGRVGKAGSWELGWCEVKKLPAADQDPLFVGFERQEKIFQLHQDTFTLPSQAVHLSSRSLCRTSFSFWQQGLRSSVSLGSGSPHDWPLA